MEGVNQRGKIEEEQAEEQRREASDESPAVYERRREIEENQKRARKDLLAEVNDGTPSDPAGA